MVFAMSSRLRQAQTMLACAAALGWPAVRTAAGQTQSRQHPPVSTISSGAQIHGPAATYSYPLRRVYRYSAEWRMVTAGTAALAMRASGTNHTSSLTAESAGLVSLLFPVHDRLESSFDPRTFCSIALQKHAEEGSRRREAHVQFQYDHARSIFEQKDLVSGEVKREEHPIPKCVTDTVSGFYYVASLPLAPASVYNFPISDGGPTSEVTAQVEGREQVKVPAGTYQAVRVSLAALSGPLLRKGKVWAWYSDDPRRVLVQMRVKVKWGTVTFRLKQVDGP
jgi:Protein of unknown function (DUF3108)